MLAELRETLREARATPAPPFRRLARSSAAAARKALSAHDEATRLASASGDESCLAAVLSGAAYLTVVSELLERAERSIAVLLLFMRAGGRPRHVINRLIDALIAARQRGVDVRVLLDRDADDGPMRSRLVNAAAVDRLDEAGVAVRTGQPGARQHAKVVLVDGRHVLTGSHNWTARSIYRTHDTSVYVSSEPLRQTLAAVFDRWWHESAAAD